MHIEPFLDRLHAVVVGNPWLQRFTVLTRVLLAVAFIPPSLVKIFGMPFTQLGTDTPIGYFFDALYHSGFWYNFIGWAQLSAAMLLLIPRTATLGALLYFPIILNIAVITPSLHFTGTPLITSLMLLASVYLLCWDYDQLKSLWPFRRVQRSSFGKREYAYEALLWGLGGGLAYTVLALLGIGNMWRELGISGGVLAVGSGIGLGLYSAWHLRHLPLGGRAPAQPTPTPAHHERSA